MIASILIYSVSLFYFFFFFQAEDGIRDKLVTGVQTCALPISIPEATVAWAAVASGIAGRVIDVEEYRAELDARLGRAREGMRGLTTRAQQAPQRIVFPEGEDARIVRAARVLADDGVAAPILLGDPALIPRHAHGVRG